MKVERIEIVDCGNKYWILKFNGEEVCTGYKEDLINDLNEMIEDFENENL